MTFHPSMQPPDVTVHLTDDDRLVIAAELAAIISADDMNRRQASAFSILDTINIGMVRAGCDDTPPHGVRRPSPAARVLSRISKAFADAAHWVDG